MRERRLRTFGAVGVARVRASIALFFGVAPARVAAEMGDPVVKHVSQGPHIDAERRLIRNVLVLGAIGGLTTWAVVFATAGVTGLYVLAAICVLVSAAWARAVGA